ncbi:MAG TPA: MazG family protein, partial [Steroidobacteraceae bacterium]
AAVARGIREKLIRRHPHVFEDQEPRTDPRELSRIWEEQKARERAQAMSGGAAADHSALAHVPRALPALTRAAKLGRRAARVGFDWEYASQVRDKVLEEVREIEEALADESARDEGKLAEEVGDLLFAAANWSLHLDIDPEEALRAANAKFERRFRRMEVLAAAQGAHLAALDAAQWDALWRQAKREV